MKTFPKGGVHPPENKITADSPIRELQIPEEVTIPVSQHLGAPATIIVEKGARVKAGEVIATREGFVSANIHSSVSGTVTKIDSLLDSSGYKRPCIVIKTDGDGWADGIDTGNEIVRDITLGQKEIVSRCAECGIVGMGGATFPSHVKLSIPPGKSVEVLIINGVECEPYLTSDHRVMLEHGEEMIIGVEILKRALGVSKALIGIENNKPDAIQHLSKIAAEYEGIEVHPLKVKYPQGGEKQLIKALINREVPSGGLPVDVGTVVHNVGTALAVYHAVQKNRPLVDRVVNVTGKHLSQPGNFRVRIGTPVATLVDAAGGMPENTGKIVNGGPMMGKAVGSLDVPVTKGTSGIILFEEAESLRKKTGPCIRCGKCISACALGLEPHLLMTLSAKELYERSEKERIMDCMECGSCSYICPANRPLLDYIRLGKSNVGKMIRARKQN